MHYNRLIMTQRQKTQAIAKAHKRMSELVEELDSWLETIEIMQQFPNLDEDFKKAWEEYERGELIPLEEIFKEHGYVSRYRKPKRQKKHSQN